MKLVYVTSQKVPVTYIPPPFIALPLLKVVLYTLPFVIFSRYNAPPLPPVALLPLKVECLIVPSVVFTHLIAPPSVAVLFMKRDSSTVDEAPLKYIAPPEVAVLFVKLEFITFA